MYADRTDEYRRQRLNEINTEPSDREALAAVHGRVWDTAELNEEFAVIGFLAPFVVVRRKADGRMGSLEFQNNPRFFFNFVPDDS